MTAKTQVRDAEALPPPRFMSFPDKASGILFGKKKKVNMLNSKKLLILPTGGL